MKIECLKEKLGEAVGKAEKIAGKNPTLPVLAGLHLKTEGSTLSIRATNLDLGILITIGAKILEEGEVVVPAQTFHAFLNSLHKEKNITLESSGQSLKIKTERTEAVLKTLPAEDFPIIPQLSTEDVFSIPIEDFLLGLKSVQYAAAVGSMKPELSSIYIAYDGELVFAATDGFRLAEKRIKTKKVPEFKYILLPQKNASEIVRIFDGVDDDVAIVIEENQIALTAGGVYVTSRIINGIFPDYKQIMPKEGTAKVVVLKQDLVSSLKTSVVFSDAFNQLHLNVSPSAKKFSVETKNSNIGENVYEIESKVEGQDLEINVNHRYFVDCFSSIPEDTLTLSFNGEARPIVVRGSGNESFVYLVMPMNRS